MQYTFILVCCSSLFYVTHGHSVQTMLCTLKKKNLLFKQKRISIILFFSMKQADIKRKNNFVGDQLQMTHLMDSTKHTEEFSALSECLLLISN